MRDELLYLKWKYFSPKCAHRKPLTHQGRKRSEEELRHGRDALETGGDDLTRVLWEIQNNSIIRIRVRELDCDSQKKEPIVFYWIVSKIK